MGCWKSPKKTLLVALPISSTRPWSSPSPFLALVISYNIPELLTPEASVTIVKNPGDPNMQIIIKNMDQIQILNMTDKIAGGQGTKMGTAYRLENGMVVYVPENDPSPDSP